MRKKNTLKRKNYKRKTIRRRKNKRYIRKNSNKYVGGRPEWNECAVCYHQYNEGDHMPVMLPCGHSFCYECVQEMRRIARARCPTCRESFPAVLLTSVNFAYRDCEEAWKIERDRVAQRDEWLAVRVLESEKMRKEIEKMRKKIAEYDKVSEKGVEELLAELEQSWGEPEPERLGARAQRFTSSSAFMGDSSPDFTRFGRPSFEEDSARSPPRDRSTSPSPFVDAPPAPDPGAS